MRPHSRGATSARAVAKITLRITLEDQRAQGMPGDDLTHGPPATKKAGGSHHRFGRINRHSLRDGVTVYIALSPVTFAWLPPSFARSIPRP
jgi:hypothetical protein